MRDDLSNELMDVHILFYMNFEHNMSGEMILQR